MKRTWITVKRGLLEPKHRFALGELVWLFIYILDRTNWEAGTIEEWLDRGAAEEMEMPIETLRDQRRKLETKGYITCERKQKGIRIIVHNWTNPKEYTGKVYNKKSLGDTPSFTPDCTPDCTPDFNSPEENDVPSYSQKSKIKNQNNTPSEDLMISELNSIFTKKTNILFYKNDEWVGALQNMSRQKVTPDILSEVIDEMRNPTNGNKKLTISGPWSCEKMAISRAVDSGGSDKRIGRDMKGELWRRPDGTEYYKEEE